MEKENISNINWDIEGMDCANCALTIKKILEKNGADKININPLSGKATFVHSGNLQNAISNISDAGYTVVNFLDKKSNTKGLRKLNLLSKFLICIPFTLLLMAHMLPLIPKLFHSPILQLLLCLPVYIIGCLHFYKSAWGGLKNGMANMNLLILLGASVSFIYSIVGSIILKLPNTMFFETTASIFTLVFLGNWLEEKALKFTKSQLDPLLKSQKIMAHMVAFDNEYKEQIFDIENSALQHGDFIQINNGEQIPADCKIINGTCSVNESLITGESLPVVKTKKDFLIGGSTITQGNVKAMVTAVGNNTIVANIITLMQNAQNEKSPLQKKADVISAWFVPLIIIISIISFFLNYLILHQTASASCMRAVAVLVIACPCAMGLATPAAIAVGLGRAAKNGILFKSSDAIEKMNLIKQVVFDKTGTLTSGDFTVSNIITNENIDFIKNIISALEKSSSHPIGKSLYQLFKNNNNIALNNINEIVGKGIEGYDNEKNKYELITNKFEDNLNLILLKNNISIATLTVNDELRIESKNVINALQKNSIEVKLLSGDNENKCKLVAEELNIKDYKSFQKPEDKLLQMDKWNKLLPTAMVGDGVNDAPTLAKATVGITLGNASQLAILSADIVLMKNGLEKLPLAFKIAKATTQTIKSNLFWAFAYNIIAIPFAALGYLPAVFASLIMGMSDIVLAINSIWLNYKKL